MTMANDHLTAWTEKDLLRNVRQLAEAGGWLVYHAWSSLHSPGSFVILAPASGLRRPVVLENSWGSY